MIHTVGRLVDENQEAVDKNDGMMAAIDDVQRVWHKEIKKKSNTCTSM